MFMIITRFKNIGKAPLCNLKANTAPCICGKSFLLCWRCTGVIMGVMISKIIFNLLLNITMKLSANSFLLFMLFILPMILDGTAQYFMGYRSTNVRRFITGLLAGIGIEIFF